MSTPNWSESFPTVLVAESGSGTCNGLVDGLRRDGYLVLEAEDGPAALRFITTHSRPIQLLVMNLGMGQHVLADRLKEYRPEMSVLFVGQDQHAGVRDMLTPETVLAQVRVFFRNREAMAARSAREGRTPFLSQAKSA